MRIAVAAPIATADLATRLSCGGADLPAGYLGAPLTAVLIGELLDRGHEVCAVTVDYRLDAPRPVLASGPGLALHILPGRRHAWRFNGLRLGRALDFFREERRAIAATLVQAAPDVVHAHWTYEFALAAIASGLPHVVTAHDSAQQVLKFTRSPYRGIRALMSAQALRRACCLTAVSDYLAREITAAARMVPRVIPNPVAAQALARGAARDSRRAGRIAMVCNGWGELKNPEPALRAFGLLRAAWPEAELHLFGADFGPGERAANWVARNSCADGMSFHGLLPHRLLIDHLAGLDLLLHPALEESFGVVLAEAMALGLPVVAGAASGAVPWVVGDGQWLVDVRSPQAIAAALNQALNDPRRYAAASQAGRARALATFAAASVADAYLALYEQARVTQARTVHR